MKNKYWLGLVMLGFLILPFIGRAETLATKLKGRILLQVEANGEAWYINPANEERYFLGRPADAFQLMRDLGLGISNADYDAWKGIAPSRLSGKILLKVQANGEAYYVNPLDLKLHFLGRPDDAFALMRKLGLGISDANLLQIKIRTGYGIQIIPTGNGSTNTTATTTEEIVIEEEVATSTDTNLPEEEVATTTPEVLPTCEFTAEYFKNMELSGFPVLTQKEIGINHEWWTGKPEGVNYKDEFSARWTGDCDFLAGDYKFTAVFDDAVKVYVDDVLIINSWEKIFEKKTIEKDLTLTAGKHKVVVEYFEYRLDALVKVDWQKK
ncbi:MAG: PA14 domain-containing protein [Candidatus Magasanikbacteria bacterium]|nr:PA14 domain-containing protein [Candidatus Magasanikbacteria bacterium]